MEMSLDLNHVGFNHFDLAANEADELHTHDCFQLSIPLNNPVQVYYNDQWRVIQPDEGLIVAPGDFHQHEARDAKSEILLVGVSEELLRQVIGDQLEESVDMIDFSPWQKGKMRAFFQTARRVFQTAAFEGMDQCSELEWELACLFLESQQGSHTHLLRKKASFFNDHPIVHRAKEFINSYYQENLNLEILAYRLNVSKYHLHRVFKQATGLTPTEYVHDVRMEKARWLIQSQDMDITAIAYEVGYQSLSTFRRVFKKYHRLNPHEYRKLM